MLIGRYSAILDACVLHRAFVRNALLWLSHAQLFRPLWSDEILDEWQGSIIRRKADVDKEALADQRQTMTAEFEDAMVSGHQALVPCVTLPDVKDQHVLAAAIVGRADAIVTENLKDFPEQALSVYAIEAIHPDAFLVNVIDLDPSRAIAALKDHRSALSRSTPTPDEYVARFDVEGMHQTRVRLKEFVGLL